MEILPSLQLLGFPCQIASLGSVKAQLGQGQAELEVTLYRAGVVILKVFQINRGFKIVFSGFVSRRYEIVWT